jgi:hypothetical protein
MGPSTTGRRAAEVWLRDRGLSAPALTPWHVEVSLDVRDAPATPRYDERTDSRFRIELYSEEWGVFFCHRGQASWIRVTGLPFVHGRDDFGLRAMVTGLKDVHVVLRDVERRHSISFRRNHALIRTNVPGAELSVRLWVHSL